MPDPHPRRLALAASLAALAALPAAEEADAIEVVGRADSMVGLAGTASEGVVGAEQILARPFLRTGELLEVVPGMIVTQHSGTGKANQYFLRGFNLDHGTDFATTVAGMPVNMRTHGHGQGYTDLNFLIPELVSTVAYGKGVYGAAHGDFASAGSADIALDWERGAYAALTVGMDAYGRALAVGTAPAGDGRLLYAVEAQRYDGPWENPEDLRRLNGALGWRSGDQWNGWSVLAMAYDARWDATDQIPARAVASGEVGRLGAIDPSDGGESSRYSLSGDLRFGGPEALTTIAAYAIAYRMRLWSNFTYALDDPVDGDQFEQHDERWILGGGIAHAWSGRVGGVAMSGELGVQVRHDAIGEVGLYKTRRRERLSGVRVDEVAETSIGAYAAATQRWTPWLRTTPAVRVDRFWFDVDSDTAANSGTAADAIASPKLAVALGPWGGAEVYAAIGQGFHSNDARGTTITVDPGSGAPAERVDPLVRTTGGEVGVRAAVLPGLQATLTLWRLDIDSELLFVGDAGATEATRPSRRVGVEWTGYWAFGEAWSVDLDYAWTRARFTDGDAAGDRIPGAVEDVLAAGIAYGGQLGWFGALRLRHFGPRPLLEDGSVRSQATTSVNAQLGHRWRRWSIHLDALNLLDSDDHDIDYYYESRLASEASPVEDVHFHPIEPLTLRLTAAARF